MDKPTDQTTSTRSIRRLTVAVWVLVAASLLNTIVVLFTNLSPYVFASRIADALPVTVASGSHRVLDQYEGFSEWPLERQIKSASAIVVTTYKQEGPKLKCIVTEILKKEPGTVLNYKVGDEYPPGSRYPKDNANYGDGQVVFFVGSPAAMRLSLSYWEGRIMGLGDMPLTMLKDMVTQTK